MLRSDIQCHNLPVAIVGPTDPLGFGDVELFWSSQTRRAGSLCFVSGAGNWEERLVLLELGLFVLWGWSSRCLLPVHSGWLRFVVIDDNLDCFFASGRSGVVCMTVGQPCVAGRSDILDAG